MPSPIQHLTVFVTLSTTTAEPVGNTVAMNTDRPAGYLNAWTDSPVTDPSTNNEVDGAGYIRNQFVDGTTKTRVVRSGGSGRPQYRRIGTPVSPPPPPPECVCRTYHIAPGFEETYQDFTICDDEEFPQDFTNEATIGWTFDPLIAPGPDAPTLSEVLELIRDATGNPEVTPFDDFTDVPCGE